MLIQSKFLYLRNNSNSNFLNFRVNLDNSHSLHLSLVALQIYKKIPIGHNSVLMSLDIPSLKELNYLSVWFSFFHKQSIWRLCILKKLIIFSVSITQKKPDANTQCILWAVSKLSIVLFEFLIELGRVFLGASLWLSFDLSN